MIRVELPAHLRTLAHVNSEIKLEVEGPATQRSVLDALEARYPMLRGTIRDHVTQQRRASCASSPARKTCRMNRPTPRCPKPSRRAKSPSSLSERWPAAEARWHFVNDSSVTHPICALT
jgi:sulfur-carrier protein